MALFGWEVDVAPSLFDPIAPLFGRLVSEISDAEGIIKISRIYNQIKLNQKIITMKKLFILLVVAITATSCSIMKQTATEQNVSSKVIAASIADLDVSNQKITYTYTPSNRVRKAGVQNCINVAITEALLHNGGGDVLVETHKAIIESYGFGKKVKSVTVSGYPAKYKNFRSVDDATLSSGIVNGNLIVTNPCVK